MAGSENFLFLTLRTFSATGGIEKVCRVFTHALAQLKSKGISASIFSMYDRPADIQEKYTTETHFRGFSGNQFSFIFKSVTKGLASDQIVLSHINLLLVGWLIKKLAPRKKLLLFAHGIEVWQILSPMRRHMLKSCDMLIAVSSYTRDQLIRVHNVHPEKIQVLNNCIDPFLPPPLERRKLPSLMRSLGLREDDFVLMTLTRLSSSELYKGYDQVLKVVAEMPSQHPQIKYIVVGKSDTAERERLGRLVNELGISSQVIFTGFVPDEELADYFSIADLFIMPSKKEGFGIVFLEAMYYGLPVIAGNADGSVDALCKGELGLVVNPDDIDEIIQAVEKVISDRVRFLPDRSVLINKFSFKSYCRQLIRIFNLPAS